MLELDDILLLLGPRDIDKEALQEWRHASKVAPQQHSDALKAVQMKRLELFDNRVQGEGQPEDESLGRKMLLMLVDNLQVSIRNIQIRSGPHH